MTEKNHVSKKKIKTVKELSELMKENKTILVASIKNIPASQFQEISKKLRGKAIIKVPKKSLIDLVFDSSNDEHIKKLKEKVDDSVAIIFSNLEPFDLASELLENKTSVRAKTGQTALEDIEVPAGPTDLVPGPAISELGALGIPVIIDKGKISIKEAKVIAKKNEKISRGAAEIMNKLDIKPFKSGFVPLAAFNNHSKEYYNKIQIDKEGTLNELKESFARALGFAVSIGYSSEDTIRFLLRKATADEIILEKFIKEENVQGIKSGETA